MEIMDSFIEIEQNIITLWIAWDKHLPRPSQHDLLHTSKSFDPTTIIRKCEHDNWLITYNYVGDVPKNIRGPTKGGRDFWNHCHITLIDAKYHRRKEKGLCVHCD